MESNNFSIKLTGGGYINLNLAITLIVKYYVRVQEPCHVNLP